MPDPIKPVNPEVAMSENSSDLEAQVAARAAAIEAKVADKLPAPPAEAKLDKGFFLDCLNRNKVGDAALFCALFRGKYVFVQEWEKFLYWAGHYWKVDMRNQRAMADAERRQCVIAKGSCLPILLRAEDGLLQYGAGGRHSPRDARLSIEHHKGYKSVYTD